MQTLIALPDVAFHYWLDEYDTLTMDSVLDANYWLDDYFGADTGLAATPTLCELRELFDLDHTPLQARALLASATHDTYAVVSHTVAAAAPMAVAA